MARRQLVIVKTVAPTDEREDGLPVLGELDELLELLRQFNTAPDGGETGATSSAMGLLKLYGPGMTMELMAADGEVRQVMVNMTDEDFAFPVLVRACRMHHWTMLDPGTGQRLRF